MSQDEAICPTSGNACVGRSVCEGNGLCVRAHFAPVYMLDEDYAPLVHFVGFRGEEYWSAVRVFGLPDVYHRVWDQRAQQEIAPGCDTVVFARRETEPSPYNFDDSNQEDDPAAKERLA